MSDHRVTGSTHSSPDIGGPPERGMVRTSSKSFFGVFKQKEDKGKEVKKKGSTEEVHINPLLAAQKERSATVVTRAMSSSTQGNLNLNTLLEMGYVPSYSHSFGGETTRTMTRSSSSSPEPGRKNILSSSTDSNPVIRVAAHEPTGVFDNTALWEEAETEFKKKLQPSESKSNKKLISNPSELKKEKKDKKEKASSAKGSLKDSLSKRFKKTRGTVQTEGNDSIYSPQQNRADTASGSESPSPVNGSRLSPSSSGPILESSSSTSSADSPPPTNSNIQIRPKTLLAPRRNTVFLPPSSEKETFRQGKVVAIQKFSSITDLISAASRERKSLQQEMRVPPLEAASRLPTKLRNVSKESNLSSSSPGLKHVESPQEPRSAPLAENTLRRTKSLPTNMTLEEQNAVLSRITWEQTNRPNRKDKEEKEEVKVDHLSSLSDELLFKILEFLTLADINNYSISSKGSFARVKGPEIWLRLLRNYSENVLKPPKDKPLWEDVGLPSINGEILTFTKSETDVNNKLTLNQLVTKLTPGATTVVDSDDYGAFLATYKSFTTSQNLVRKLVERYHVPNPPTTDEKELTEFKRMIQKPIQLRVCRIMKTIVDNHAEDLDDKTFEYIGLFIRGMMALGDNFYRSLVVSYEKKSTSQKIIQRAPSQSSAPLLSKSAGVTVRMKTRKVVDSKQKITIRNELELLEVKGTALAEQLTLIEFELFRNIRTEEFASIEGKSKISDPTAGMPQFIAHFNDISRWVQEEILAEEKLKPRARRLEKFIKLAHQLREMNNFETLMAITSSIGDTAIHRLTATRNEVQPQYWKMLEDLQDLMSSEKSYSKYRNAIKDVIDHGLPCIPYIGVYRRDLIYHEEGQKSNGAINFGKSRQIFSIIQEIRNFQSNSYQLRVHPSVNSKLRCLPPLPDGVSHEDYKKTVLWQLSLSREARSANRASVMF
eukprot:TRINITY_DN3069_c0_g1_i1.p1 TRINITY_DN3069_c0_g1~~TRINITY_DN3069_c0_g1_i1.p1  ORF type:complete len:941 (-),score=271.32 TRINITY_DN3069_c0_g1_i1:82-2904(-)